MVRKPEGIDRTERRCGAASALHIRSRDRAVNGFHLMANYEFLAQPADELVRGTEAWRAWCWALQAKEGP